MRTACCGKPQRASSDPWHGGGERAHADSPVEVELSGQNASALHIATPSQWPSKSGVDEERQDRVHRQNEPHADDYRRVDRLADIAARAFGAGS